jgi:AhpD family alkylhydroperoxidase
MNVNTRPTDPRIPPLPPREWPDAMRSALAALVPENPRHPLPVQGGNRPKGLNALSALAQHPELTRAFNTFNGHILFGTTLSLRQRELIVVRVAILRSCDYQLKQHVVQGLDAGLSQEEIDRIALTPAAPEWSPIDAAILRAVDELVSDACISEQTWSVLAGELDTHQLMDLIFTVACYETVAMFFNSAGVQVDDDLVQYLENAQTA